ncbi:MAG: threonylcarbamoyl-AMP synthase [Lachnospiraceae bacterium]|nr:threonylcarbamoyl-AMP synthase [Lachnospiraceae bacterium]MCI9017975.1 threonylcarbamoyl-AMP synthase [Lachnospiraceae bacterium]
METQIRKLDYAAIDMDIIEKAGRILKEGGLVAFPTETVYGLGGNALNPASSEKIYAAKGRPSDNPLIIHISEKDDVYQIAEQVSERAKQLMEAFWPGPLTLIFSKKALVPDKTTGGLSTVAVRMPSDKIARALIRASGGFVAAPSANASGRPSTTTAAHVAEDLSGRIEMILDGGQAVIGLESTIVDVSEEQPVILRPGVITRAMMESVIGPVEIDRAVIAPDSHVKPKAPGMKYRHYAPKASLTIVEGETKDVIEAVNRLSAEAAAEGKRVGIMATDETAGCYGMGLVRSLGARSREEEISMHLFEVLRSFDETDVDCIYSESFGDAAIGQAIMNRLLKAAGHRVIEV